MAIPNISTLDGLRILLVDDDLDSCVWMTCLLEFYGVEVHSTFTVDRALRAFVELWPDLVITDIAMPDEDGYSLLRQIRQIEEPLEKPTPVIALTALGQSEAGFSKPEARFDQWFLKPVNTENLVEAIANLTGRSMLIDKLVSSY
ncbi:response regulator [Nostoc sp. PA-18-2419]|uniref:response regulator n=1 Tax=Nostoc sp. PA-18-2419 TaxID=2575443 RepID=UPI0011093D3E|nr:response regulator [Nostoc sp. PA-18-2419]